MVFRLAFFAWLGLAGCAAAPPPVSYVGPAVSPAEEHRTLTLFQDRAGQIRQAAEQRVRAVGAGVLAAMDVAKPIGFQLLDSQEVNAYVRDGTVYVTLGMIRFVQNDDELALVVAHEVGHAVVDGQPEAGRLSPEDRERMADYHALLGLHRAGYDIKKACEVWQRMATELTFHVARGNAHGQAQWGASHPSFAERYVRAQKLAESPLGNSPAPTPPTGSTAVPAAPSTSPSFR
jgi:predicted Zn-dependent protease